MKKHGPLPKTTAERFWPKVVNTGVESCWKWTGAKHQYGYGRILHNGAIHESHRVSYELHYGAIPELMHVCHKCDNPECCNPLHLFLGTNTDNRRDSVSKRRHSHGSTAGRVRHPDRYPVGEQCSHSKLTESDVREIRTTFATGDITKTSLANKYGVTIMAISRVISRKTWKHVK